MTPARTQGAGRTVSLSVVDHSQHGYPAPESINFIKLTRSSLNILLTAPFNLLNSLECPGGETQEDLGCHVYYTGVINQEALRESKRHAP